MRISDWSSDVCSSDLEQSQGLVDRHAHSFSRGLNVARLQGRVRASSWARMIFSHAVRQADVAPGRQNTNVPLASPANARDCSDEVPISSKLIDRNSTSTEEVCVGKECVSRYMSRCSPYHSQ